MGRTGRTTPPHRTWSMGCRTTSNPDLPGNGQMPLPFKVYKGVRQSPCTSRFTSKPLQTRTSNGQPTAVVVSRWQRAADAPCAGELATHRYKRAASDRVEPPECGSCPPLETHAWFSENATATRLARRHKGDWPQTAWRASGMERTFPMEPLHSN